MYTDIVKLLEGLTSVSDSDKLLLIQAFGQCNQTLNQRGPVNIDGPVTIKQPDQPNCCDATSYALEVFGCTKFHSPLCLPDNALFNGLAKATSDWVYNPDGNCYVDCVICDDGGNPTGDGAVRLILLRPNDGDPNVRTDRMLMFSKSKAGFSYAISDYMDQKIFSIMAWGSTLETIPEGWAPCDGTSYTLATTPDIQGRTIFGYKVGDVDFGTLFTTGGTKTHTHTGDASLGDILISGTTDPAPVSGTTSTSTTGSGGSGSTGTEFVGPLEVGIFPFAIGGVTSEVTLEFDSVETEKTPVTVTGDATTTLTGGATSYNTTGVEVTTEQGNDEHYDHFHVTIGPQCAGANGVDTNADNIQYTGSAQRQLDEDPCVNDGVIFTHFIIEPGETSIGTLGHLNPYLDPGEEHPGHNHTFDDQEITLSDLTLTESGDGHKHTIIGAVLTDALHPNPHYHLWSAVVTGVEGAAYDFTGHSHTLPSHTHSIPNLSVACGFHSHDFTALGTGSATVTLAPATHLPPFAVCPWIMRVS